MYQKTNTKSCLQNLSRVSRVGVLAVLSLLALYSPVFGGNEFNTSTGWTLKGAPLAMHGFDPVAYFTMDEAVQGKAQFSTEYKEGTYRFASEANKQMFLENPSAYLPSYGGYCAYGTTKGKKFDGDPRLFKVVGGRLYFNLNPDVYKTWLQDPEGYIKQADAKWRDIHDKEPADLW
jgi:YHS domain-containing protein